MRTDARTLAPRLSSLALLLGSIAACSSSGGGHTLTTNQDTGGQAGDAGSSDTGGSAGTSTGGTSDTGGSAGMSTGGTSDTGGSAGTSTGGDSETAGSGGAGGDSAGGDGGTGGDSAGAGGTGGAADPGFTGPFNCTLVAGLLVTSEWYNAGFENDGVNGDIWEGKFAHYGYIDIWAQDNSFTWTAPITSPCIANADTPDRVIFTAWSWEISDETAYVTTTAAAIDKFIQNYPSMKRMDLMTIVRCPGDEVTNPSGQMCNPNAAIPPIVGVTDHNAGQQDCYVAPYIDSAFDKVAAMYPGLVYVGKKFYSPACQNPVDGAHLYSYNNQIAQDIATYYADPSHP